MEAVIKPVPTIGKSNARQVLKVLATQRSLLAGMSAIHQELGNLFAIRVLGFNPIIVAGSAGARELLVSKQREFKWRIVNDPVTHLLRHGVLVEDGESHDRLRSYMQPALKRSRVIHYHAGMLECCDKVISSWDNNSTRDMLVEMRKLALMILMKSLFSVDILPDLERLWEPILRILKYISPGLWIFKPDLIRPGYRSAIREVDEYLFSIIRERRMGKTRSNDMLDDLLRRDDMDDDLIRDQMLTMLIAGHDTSTALLAWTLYLLGKHPEAKERVRNEVDQVLGNETPTAEDITQLHYLDQVIKETLRLYPPIHAANRVAGADANLQGCPVDKGSRVMFSYYLTHRDERVWGEPERFVPERFEHSNSRNHPPFSYLPFGGGPRNCIGAAFAQSEVKLILARILQKVDLELVNTQAQVHMGATLEPKPGVIMRINHRGKSDGKRNSTSMTSLINGSVQV